MVYSQNMITRDPSEIVEALSWLPRHMSRSEKAARLGLSPGQVAAALERAGLNHSAIPWRRAARAVRREQRQAAAR